MAMTLGEFRDATKDGSEFVPILVNGVAATGAALVRDTGTGDLACHITVRGLVQMTITRQPADEFAETLKPAAPEAPPETPDAPPVVDETDTLDEQASDSAGGTIRTPGAVDETEPHDDSAHDDSEAL